MVLQLFGALSTLATHRCHRTSEFRTMKWVWNVEKQGRTGAHPKKGQGIAENLGLTSS